jgi:hypothetical protein
MKHVHENETKNHILLFVDLDGTLVTSKVNNTFDFINFYHSMKLRNKKLSVLLYIVIKLIILTIIKFFKKFGITIDLDTQLINMLFLLKNKNELRKLSLNWLYILLKRNLMNVNFFKIVSELSKKFIIDEIFLLSCCSEFPACIIAEKFNLKCLSREFIVKKNIILDMKDKGVCWLVKTNKVIRVKLKYSNFEFKFKIFYVLDQTSAVSENEILKLFDVVIILNNN